MKKFFYAFFCGMCAMSVYCFADLLFHINNPPMIGLSVVGVLFITGFMAVALSTTESNARKKKMKNAKPNKTELTNSCVSILKRNSKKNGTMNKKERLFLSATSVKQSKKLLEAGYSADMADMAWVKPNTFKILTRSKLDFD